MSEMRICTLSKNSYKFSIAIMIEQKEEIIEANICEYLMLRGAKVDKIISEGYFDQNK